MSLFPGSRFLGLNWTRWAYFLTTMFSFISWNLATNIFLTIQGCKYLYFKQFLNTCWQLHFSSVRLLLLQLHVLVSIRTTVFSFSFYSHKILDLKMKSQSVINLYAYKLYFIPSKFVYGCLQDLYFHLKYFSYRCFSSSIS